ncbi:unnamed protein product [Caenorhabditis brenneri]
MGKKKSEEKQKKRKGPIQRAPAQAQDNQSENSSTSRSRSPQLGQPFNNTMNLGFVVTLLNDIKPALVLIDRDAGVIDHRPLISELLDRIDNGLTELILRDPQNENPVAQHQRLTLHDLRVHLQAALDDCEDFVQRGARVGEITADETDVEDEARPSGCNAPSDDVVLGEPGPSNWKMAEYHDCPSDRLHSSVHPIIRTRRLYY